MKKQTRENPAKERTSPKVRAAAPLCTKYRKGTNYFSATGDNYWEECHVCALNFGAVCPDIAVTSLPAPVDICQYVWLYWRNGRYFNAFTGINEASESEEESEEEKQNDEEAKEEEEEEEGKKTPVQLEKKKKKGMDHMKSWVQVPRCSYLKDVVRTQAAFHDTPCCWV